jgi:hypothetical protein
MIDPQHLFGSLLFLLTNRIPLAKMTEGGAATARDEC